MDRPTVDVYERMAEDYDRLRPPKYRARARRVAAAALRGMPVADLGCGPGRYLADLPRPAVALDGARAMLELARRWSPDALAVQADLEQLPVRDRALGGAWARNSYLHVPRVHLPLALARLHWAMAVGAPLVLSLPAGEGEGSLGHDDFPGRLIVRWRADGVADLLVGAGFELEVVEEVEDVVWAGARRGRMLPDTVGPGMRVLVCGLNPSVVAADAGYGYAGATNRFWPVAVEAGLVSRARDQLAALTVDGVGMTDLVKRATPGAGELSAAEYREGAARVGRLAAWLRPRLVLFVGLAGWRAAVDAKAQAGLQPAGVGGCPAYVMPSTSGLNAHSRRADLVAHLKCALAAAEG